MFIKHTYENIITIDIDIAWMTKIKLNYLTFDRVKYILLKSAVFPCMQFSCTVCHCPNSFSNG